MPKIIFTADDYGCYTEIDNAVISAANKGLINSVAAFANGPNADYRLKRLAEETNVDIGCHLTITSGDAVGANSSFTKSDGRFRPPE
jgi:predicted glycoside hydrolase/deacetylase ChbG (UPF0249 family)